MEIAPLLGLAFVLFGVAAIVASVVGVVRMFLMSRAPGTSIIDRYLASGAGNHNPPDLPPSYTPVMRGGRTNNEQLDVAMLDTADTQRQKALNLINTVTNELRNHK